MIVGYSFPTLIVLCTLIAEHSAPECAQLKPRFGEEGCFFAGNLIFSLMERYNHGLYFLKVPIYNSFNNDFFRTACKILLVSFANIDFALNQRVRILRIMSNDF